MSDVLVHANETSSRTFTSNQSGEEKSCSLSVRMYVDAARDGKLTDRQTESWTWGATGRGAILMVNETSSPKFRVLASIMLKSNDKVPEKTKLGGTLSLSSDDAKRVRIFDGKVETLLLGEKTKSCTVEVPPDGLTLRIEAACFERSIDELPIYLSFTPTVNGKSGATQIAAFRPSPWILPPRVYSARMVYCCSIDETFVKALEKLSGLPVNALLISEKGQQFVQDAMKFGYASYGKEVRPSILRMPAEKWGKIFPDKNTFDGMPVFAVAETCEKNNASDGGNIQVSPPTDAYPFGRIYYSLRGGPHEIDKKLREFLHAQVVQAPFTLDASWLTVGHVDEMISFLPSQKELIACVPSPRLAYRILIAAAAAKSKTQAELLKKRTLGEGEKKKDAAISVAKMLTEPEYQNCNFGWASKNIVEDIEKKPAAKSPVAYLDDVVNAVNQALGKVRVIEVPVLFAKTRNGYEALTANIVNMVVDGSRCVFPKPSGPVVEAEVDLGVVKVGKGKDLFEEYTIAVLRHEGYKAFAIDTWSTYHNNHGEAHCATAVLREFTPLQWWNFEPKEQKNTSKVERKGRIVTIDRNNDCFFHAVLWHTDHQSYRDLKKVSELRNTIAKALVSDIFPFVDFLPAVEKALETMDYQKATESLLSSASKGSAALERYLSAKAKANDDYLGQNVVDALFRMRFNHEEIEGKSGKCPAKMKKGTIWGDDSFIADAVCDHFSRAIEIYTGSSFDKPSKVVGDLYSDDDNPIRLVYSDNHWDVYDPHG
jgi:Protein-arginine deiminase (PAD)